MPIGRTQVVGREESCDTVLLGTEVSRRHAEFRIDGPVVAVRDLDSRNGVFLNGRRCRDELLSDGDVVRCGEWVAIVLSNGKEACSFQEIANGWFGGAALTAVMAPARGIPADLPVIVQGATGTGKEGAARAIHLWSGRGGRFVPLNCATLPAELAEAELFGYRKGAFTGADSASPGLFRAAEGGSLFLDEILDLPLPLQAKLLRAIEERRVRGLGETREVTVDVRIIAATQESLRDAAAKHRFRADLFARLDGLTVELPPLRMRREDILPLFAKFLYQHSGGRPPFLEAKFVEALCLHDWPLNVRELVLLTRRLLGVHGHEPTLRKEFLPEGMRNHQQKEGSRAPASDARGARSVGDEIGGAGNAVKRAHRSTDDEEEFESLVSAMRANAGSVARAAKAIGIQRGRAYRLLRAHPEVDVAAEGSGNGK